MMAISTANAPKALAAGLGGYAGGGDYPLQNNIVRDPMQAHNSLPSASRKAKLVPGAGLLEMHHNDGGEAFPHDKGCAFCCR